MTGTYELTDEEIEKVSAYLMELSVEEGSGDIADIEALKSPENDEDAEGGEE